MPQKTPKRFTTSAQQYIAGLLAERGGKSRIARATGVTPTTAGRWAAGDPVPAKHWSAIEAEYKIAPGALIAMERDHKRAELQELATPDMTLMEFIEVVVDSAVPAAPAERGGSGTSIDAGVTRAELDQVLSRLTETQARLEALARSFDLVFEDRDGHVILVDLKRRSDRSTSAGLARSTQFGLAASGAKGKPPKPSGTKRTRPSPPAEQEDV